MISDISIESLDSTSNDSTLVDIYDEIEKCFCNFDVDVNSKMLFDFPFGITLKAKPCGKEKFPKKIGQEFWRIFGRDCWIWRLMNK